LATVTANRCPKRGFTAGAGNLSGAGRFSMRARTVAVPFN
jgi:hypothetical protein